MAKAQAPRNGTEAFVGTIKKVAASLVVAYFVALSSWVVYTQSNRYTEEEAHREHSRIWAEFSKYPPPLLLEKVEANSQAISTGFQRMEDRYDRLLEMVTKLARDP